MFTVVPVLPIRQFELFPKKKSEISMIMRTPITMMEMRVDWPANVHSNDDTAFDGSNGKASELLYLSSRSCASLFSHVQFTTFSGPSSLEVSLCFGKHNFYVVAKCP